MATSILAFLRPASVTAVLVLAACGSNAGFQNTGGDASNTGAEASTGGDAQGGMDATPGRESGTETGTGDAGGDAKPDVIRDARTDTGVLPDPDAAAPSQCPPSASTITLGADSTGSVTGDTTRGSEDLEVCGSLAPDIGYTVVVTARTGVTFETSAPMSGAGYDTVIGLFRTCGDASTEITCNDDSAGTFSRIDTLLEPGTYSLVVSGFFGDAGPYTLRWSTFSPPDNATCDHARTLTPGTPLRAQTTSGGGAAPTGTGCGYGPGTVVYYSVTLPSSTRTLVTATRVGSAPTPVLRVLDDCAATTCADANTPFTDTAGILLANTGATSRTAIVVLGSTGGGGTYDLTATQTPIEVNATCAGALELIPGVPIPGVSTAGGALTVSPCGTSGAQRFYYVNVPPEQRVTVTARAADGATVPPVLRIFDGCSSTTCLSSASGTTTMPTATVTAANFASDPRALFVSVASPSASLDGVFTLTADTSPVAANASCATATPLVADTPVTAQDLAGAYLSTSPCGSSAGPQLYYSVEIPGSTSARVTVTPADGSTYTAVVRALRACTATDCLGEQRGTAAGAPVTLTLRNDLDTARTVQLAVAATTGGTGIFAISLSLTPLTDGYALASLDSSTRPCDDLTGVTGAAAVAPTSGWSDDSTSGVLPLPEGFTTTYFGDTVTHFAVSSNGFLQLFPNAMGSASSSLSNSALPSSGAPGGIVALLWDDLYPKPAPMAGTVTRAVMGTDTDRHLTVEWNHFTAFADRTSPGEIRMQARLYATTGVVEIQWCTLTPSMTSAGSYTGEFATVGIQNAAGTVGTLASLNTAGSVTTANFLRFTPR